MEQLDKEVIDELSEPAKRVFRSLDYRSQRRMLKKAKEMGKQKKRKTQQKERIKKKSITKKQIKKEQAKERGSSTKRIKVELPLLSEQKSKILLQRYCRLCCLEQQ